MKGIVMAYLKYSGIVAFFCIALIFLSLPFSMGQTISSQENDTESTFTEPYVISVNVNEIRLDVVVLDKKGNPITDLTAADFEVYQDRLRQEVMTGVYIGNQDKAAVLPGDSLKAVPNLTLSPFTTLELEKEEVCRTIVFIVDNNSMRASHLQFAKMSVNRFLEMQMQPCDIAAVIQTGSDNKGMNIFSSDKLLIAEQVNSIGLPGFLPGPFEKAELASAGKLDVYDKLYAAALSRIYGSQISTVSYGISAMKDMPGRKIIFMLSSRPVLEIDQGNLVTTNENGEIGINFGNPSDDNSERYGNVLNRLADDALRAGVVFHTLDSKGLCAPKLQGPGFISVEGRKGSSFGFSGSNSGFSGITNLRADLGEEEPCPIEPLYSDGMNKLSYKIGGIFVQDNNFLLDGVGNKANNMIAGYYLLSYIPPLDTFTDKNKDVYHRLEVKVKRKNAEVYTRDGFYSR